jgi:diketogulonate reductase-like aldo/keto reductase
MIVTAHVPLARGKIVNDPVIGEIAKAKGKTTAQVALRWLVQQPNISVVPRTTTRERLVENLEIFDFSLTGEEMDRISALRDTAMRVVDPAVRRPVWDAG